jgi:hypothetical protein
VKARINSKLKMKKAKKDGIPSTKTETLNNIEIRMSQIQNSKSPV